MGLKILFDPVYTSKYADKCVTHFVMENTARHFLTTYPDCYVYYIKPHESCGIEFRDKLCAEFPGRVKYFDGYYKYSYRVYEFTWRPKWFTDIVSMYGKAYDWDILVTSRGPAMIQVRWVNNHSVSRLKGILICENFPFLKFKDAAKFAFAGDGEFLQLDVLLSYLASDIVIVKTDFERKGILEVAKRDLSAFYVKKLSKKILVGFLINDKINVEYPLKRLRRVDTIQTNKFLCVFTQRLDTQQKRPIKSLDAFFYTFLTGKKNIKFLVSTNSAKDVPNVNKYSFVEVYKPNRERFYTVLKRAHLCTSMSIDEGMPSSILEPICYGCIPVLVDREWSRDLVGKDYPWLVKDVAELTATIKFITDDYIKAYHAFIDWYKGYFLKNLRGRLIYYDTCSSMYDTVKKNIDLYVKESTSDIQDLITNYVARNKLKKFTINNVMKCLWDENKIMTDPTVVDVGVKSPDEWGRFLGNRPSNFYHLMYKVIRKNPGWRRGLEPGEVLVD